MEHSYSADFYERMQSQTSSSAREMVPFVMELVVPSSVVDVGCGAGIWLEVFLEQGVQRVQGVDGAWLGPDHYILPGSTFHAADLEQPLRLADRFDLAVSLEVAEHLSPSGGSNLVDSLVELAPVVLFSAAIPNQGGVHHVNEQRQSFWVAQFEARGFRLIDCLREVFWDNERVAPYYRQNCLVFIDGSEASLPPRLAELKDQPAKAPLNLVHPETLDSTAARLRSSEAQRKELEEYCGRVRKLEPGVASLGNVLRAVPALATHALRKRIRFKTNSSERNRTSQE